VCGEIWRLEEFDFGMGCVFERTYVEFEFAWMCLGKERRAEFGLYIFYARYLDAEIR